MPYTHSVSIVLLIGTGACYETDAEAGISHFIEHLCFKGTKKRRTAKEISEAIEGIGGVINGGTDKELTIFWCKVASQHFLLAADVLVDLIRNSRFAAKDIGRERQVIIEEIKMSVDYPRQRVDMLMDELLWPGQPLGRDVAGTKETVGSLTRQQIIDFFTKHYLPDNTVVSIVGDIEERQAQDIISSSLGNWETTCIAPHFSSISEQSKTRLCIEFRDIEQVNLCLGVPGLSLFHHDRFAADLLSVVLGEGMSSRLFINIREKKGLAYEIYSYADHFKDSGAITIHAGVDLGQLNNALIAILDQLSSLRNSISEIELNRAKEMTKGRLLLSMENGRNLANWFGIQEMLTERILTIDDIISLIDSVTVEDLTRIAKQLLTSEKLNLAVVGPVKEEESLLKILELQ